MRLMLFALSLSCVGLCGCDALFGPSVTGSGVARTENRQVDQYTRLSLRGSGEVDFAIGSPPTLDVIIDDNLQELIKTDVRNSLLTIESTESYQSDVGLKIEIVNPVIDGITLDGAGSVVISSVDQSTLSLTITGSGAIRATGQCQSVSIDITGSGDLDLSELECVNVSVDIAGSGSARICVSDSLNVKITGSGSVRYVGNPTIENRISGSGNVEQIIDVST